MTELALFRYLLIRLYLAALQKIIKQDGVLRTGSKAVEQFQWLLVFLHSLRVGKEVLVIAAIFGLLIVELM